MSNIDELFDRGDRHREELNELYRITKATDQRLGHGIHSLQSKIEATSNQISLQASANGRAIEASEASNRRIQDLKEIAEKGEGLAATLDVHVKQTIKLTLWSKRPENLKVSQTRSGNKSSKSKFYKQSYPHSHPG